MKKMLRPSDLAVKGAEFKIETSYDWKSQGANVTKFGTSGTTGNAWGARTDTWTD